MTISFSHEAWNSRLHFWNIHLRLLLSLIKGSFCGVEIRISTDQFRKDCLFKPYMRGQTSVYSTKYVRAIQIKYIILNTPWPWQYQLFGLLRNHDPQLCQISISRLFTSCFLWFKQSLLKLVKFYNIFLFGFIVGISANIKNLFYDLLFFCWVYFRSIVARLFFSSFRNVCDHAL